MKRCLLCLIYYVTYDLPSKAAFSDAGNEKEEEIDTSKNQKKKLEQL